jgi:DNA-binding PadR family transcriptional regulator
MAHKESLLPLQQPTFYILLSLRAGEKHGYGILKDVEQLSDGQVTLSTGTLYGALNRLLDQGFIERIEPEDRTRGKKAYRLTPAGLEVFDAEVSRMNRLLVAVRARRRAKGAQRI